MKRHLRFGLAAAALATLWGGQVGWADEEEVVRAARQVLEKHQAAVVWVSAVVKIRVQGMGVGLAPAQEQKLENVGTVIDPSGLTVVSYTGMDPMAMLRGMSVQAEGEQVKLDFKTEISDVKIRTADGREVPAKLVLRDEELDLAFVMPQQGGPAAGIEKWPHVALQQAPEVAALDRTISLGRLGKDLNRQATVSLGRVQAVVTKPRKFIVPELTALVSTGGPVFSADGRVLGIVVIRKGHVAAAGAMMSMADVPSPVIVPAEDIGKVAAQALPKKGQAEPPPAATQPAEP